jgi:hypothetical protein
VRGNVVVRAIERDDAQLLAVANEGDALAVGRPRVTCVDVGAVSERALRLRVEVVQVKAGTAVTLGAIDDLG